MANDGFRGVTGISLSREPIMRPDKGWVTTVAARSEPAAPAPRGAVARPIKKAHSSFEAVALQVFVSSMLPNDRGGKFSTGSAGRMWKSVLAEKIADQISVGNRLRLMPAATFAKALNSKPSNSADPSVQSSPQTAAAASAWQTTIEANPQSSGGATAKAGVRPTSNGE